MYNFNDHTLCRELSKNIPQLEIKSISKLERSNVISFIGTFEEYTSYLPQINNLLGINNDVIKNLFTDNSKITAKRVNINDQDLITINYSNNKIDNDLTEQALSKICDIGRGNIVEVPYLGLFKLQLRAKTVKNADEAGRQAVSRFKVNFLPCKEFSRHFSKND